MGYPAKLLNPGEEVVLDVHPHWKCLGWPALGVSFLIAASVYALAASLARWAQLALAGALAVALVWLVARYLKWASTSLVLTTHRVVSRQGVVSRTGREILLDRLSDVSYHQSLLDRLVGAGDIVIEPMGRDGQELCAGMPRPSAILAELNRVASQRAGARPAPAPEGPGAGRDRPSQL